MSRPLVATYRLQLHPGFDLRAAAGLVEYLATLGISHVYLSPIFEARAGSEHGYDGVDPTAVREALGGRAGLHDLVGALHLQGLGILADIVPNHLAADERNPWWWAVLREGPGSEDAALFDIDWDAGDGRVLLPILGAPLADVVDAGDLRIDEDGDEPVLRYFDRRFPLAPDTDTSA